VSTPPAATALDHVPVVDIGPWLTGGPDERARVAEEVDRALTGIGFLLITGHGVPLDLPDRVRAAARAVFGLPPAVKERYRARVGEDSWLPRGWVPSGVETSALSEGTPTPPDLKETYSVGCWEPTGDPALDAEWFGANVWPAEIPEFEALVTEYLGHMHGLVEELLRLAAAALGLPEDHFLASATHPTWSFVVNWYPSLTHLGSVDDGALRIGPHTDFGSLTILDRQLSSAGLQVWSEDAGWLDAPHVPGSFTVNIGDMLARWTGDRWTSNRHRVLPPDPTTPDEEITSLVFFYEADPTAPLTSVPPPIGRVTYPPVLAGDYLRAKLEAVAG
jgi:isopenicillin N synthase-like dioxygenase